MQLKLLVIAVAAAVAIAMPISNAHVRNPNALGERSKIYH
jgi:hypothetical protein